MAIKQKSVQTPLSLQRNNIQNKSNAVPLPQRHYVRAFFAALCGIIALSFVWVAILSVWLNHTLEDNATYTATVAPVVQKPAVQTFVAKTVTDQLVKNTPSADLAAALLTPEQIASKDAAQQSSAAHDVIYSSVLAVVQSPKFAAIWKETNATAERSFIQQISVSDGNFSFDLHPAIVGVVDQIKQTQLASVADKIQISPDAGNVHIASSNGTKNLHKAYIWLQPAAIGLVALTLVFAGLSVVISTHRGRTARTVLFGTGLSALLFALLLQIPVIVLSKDTADAGKQAAAAVVGTIFHSLQIASIWLGAICIAIAVGYKLYVVLHERHK